MSFLVFRYSRPDGTHGEKILSEDDLTGTTLSGVFRVIADSFREEEGITILSVEVKEDRAALKQEWRLAVASMGCEMGFHEWLAFRHRPRSEREGERSSVRSVDLAAAMASGAESVAAIQRLISTPTIAGQLAQGSRVGFRSVRDAASMIRRELDTEAIAQTVTERLRVAGPLPDLSPMRFDLNTELARGGPVLVAEVHDSLVIRDNDGVDMPYRGNQS